MTIFEVLVLGHGVGDFLFQTRWMAEHKEKRILPRLVHSIVYTLSVYAFPGWPGA